MQTSMMTYRCPYCEHVMEFEKVSNGETVTCTAPLCRKEFQVKLPEAEPERELIVPVGKNGRPERQDDGPSTQAESDERETAFSHESDDERILAIYRTPMFRRHPFRFSGYAVLVVLGVAGLVAAIVLPSIALAVFSLIPLAAGIGLFGYWWWRAKGSTLTITPRSLVLNGCRLGEQTCEIHHANLTEIHIFQPPVSRFFNTGALCVEWGTEPDEKAYIDAVSHPHALVKQIRELADN